MRLVLAALVASTGCAQLFGIDKTTGADANTDFATIQVQRVSIGASLIKGPQDMSAQMAQFYQADGTTVDGTLVGTDTFQADIPGTPNVLFTVPDMTNPQRIWATGARNQKGNYIVLEHPNPQVRGDMAKLMVDVMLPSPYVTGESFVMQAIGAWTQHSLTAGELPAPDTAVARINPTTALDYTMFTSMVGAPTITKIVAADSLLLLRYQAAALTGVFTAQPFDQTDATDAVNGSMVAVAATSTLSATYDSTTFTTRFSAVRPAVGAVSMPWRVTASPGWQVGDSNGVRLVNGTAATTATAVMDMFGNPFESLSWKALFVFAANTSRTYALSDGTNMVSVGLAANLVHVGEPAGAVNVNMPAGLPITITANAATLTTDGMTLPLDLTKPVEIAATVDKPTNTAYYMQLVELGIDASGTAPALTRKIIADAITTGMPKFTLPASLFTVGKTYYIMFRCFQGAYTEAANGDLQTITLPYDFGSLDSAVFTVGMP